MVNGENTFWFNQKYFYHKDLEFNQNGSSLEISVGLYTTDFQNYSIPTLNISIFNNKIRYNINLKYQDVLELLFSIEEINSNINTIYNNGGSEIKRIINGKNFKLGFKISKNTGKKAVLFLIANSATDFGIIAISYNLFLTIVELFKLFKRNYINIPFEISNRITLDYILEELKEIKECNKSLPSSIINMTSSTKNQESDNSNVFKIRNSLDDDPPWDTDNNETIKKTQRNFEDFMVNNINNIKIPELDKINKSVSEEQKSFFIDDILKNDVKNLDSLLMSLTVHSNPLEKFRETVSDFINSTLPSITDNELKSACYYSKRFYLYNIQNYMKNHVSIPISIPIIKYKPNNFNDENIDFAYDLLTLSVYIRLVKDKLVTKVDDALINNSILYMALRVYTDIFTFSFLDNIDHEIIIKCVMKRFKAYNNKGVFKSLNNTLKSYGFSEINEIDINTFATQIIKQVIGPNKILYICDLHKKDYNNGKIKLPFLNELNKDQIMNEFIKEEIESKLEITTAEYNNENSDNNWFESINM